MLIGYFHIVSVVIAPHETDSVLIVDPYAALSSPITTQFLETVARGIVQITQFQGCIQHSQFSLCDIRRGRASGLAGSPDLLCRPIGEASDHGFNNNGCR
jgi:hypothetical protein